MSVTMFGVVKEGIVVPDAPLPEGARVGIVVSVSMADLPPQLRAELEEWELASDEDFLRFVQSCRDMRDTERA